MINFLTGNPALLPLQKQAGGTVMGVDWRIRIDEARRIFGPEFAVQGNMDPVSIYADLPVLKQRIKSVLDAVQEQPGHIFNLGHGVMPDMDPVHVKAVVEYVHELSSK